MSTARAVRTLPSIRVGDPSFRKHDLLDGTCPADGITIQRGSILTAGLDVSNRVKSRARLGKTPERVV